MGLTFEWDAGKAKISFRKHKVRFEEAKPVFNDPLMVTFADHAHSEGEDRYTSIGQSPRGRILIVIHADREGASGVTVVRIISSRRTTALERRTDEDVEGALRTLIALVPSRTRPSTGRERRLEGRPAGGRARTKSLR